MNWKRTRILLRLFCPDRLQREPKKEVSDIDVYLVVTEENFRERMENDDTSYSNSAVCTYPGGYIDGKIIDMNFLLAAAERGSEPTRTSFKGSSAVWPRIDGMDKLISRIQRIDDAERERKMDSFYAQVRLWYEYFYREGVKKNNPYLMHRSVLETVFYASRYVLERNHVLFPCHKDLMAQIEKAADKPADYAAQALELLASPNDEKAARFFTCFSDWAGPRMNFAKALSIFVKDSEWNWINSTPPLSDC